MRAAVLEALAWRVVSDLVGRIGGRRRVSLAQVFPGDGPDPSLHLRLQPRAEDPTGPVDRTVRPVPETGVTRWIARLGPAGGRALVRRDGLDAWEADFVEPLLAGAAAEAAFADRLDQALGLRAGLPGTEAGAGEAAFALGVRLAAETLARESASRRPLAAALGAPEVGGRLVVAGWTTGLAVDDDDPAGPPLPQDLVALQDAAIPLPAVGADGERRAIVDLRAGRLWLTGGGVPGVPVDLAAAYGRDGRRLSRLVEQVRAHLGRVEAGGRPGRAPASGGTPDARLGAAGRARPGPMPGAGLSAH